MTIIRKTGELYLPFKEKRIKNNMGEVREGERNVDFSTSIFGARKPIDGKELPPQKEI